MGLVLRNRIIWTFGHGLHCKNRFSGRYEVILWYTKGAGYFFDLNAVRVPQKYPSKKYFKGPRAGELSCNPLGKNPGDYWDDVWDNIPNVKSNHVEKTIHPCQFPVGLAERLVLALCPPRGKVLDPFCGSGSTAVAALFHGREFVGCDTSEEYVRLARERAGRAARGEERFRPHDLAIVQPQAMRGMAR
jgi:adenine-specific DNA-methyltransferase